MQTSVRFTILGGDGRMRACAKGLVELGFSVLDCPASLPASWDETDILILPIPAFSGAHINGTAVSWQMLSNSIPSRVIICGGVIPENLADRIFDYNRVESFQLSGAIATAEGAIELMMQQLPITLQDSSALIIGNGRIGKALAYRLSALEVHVTVSARKETDWQQIKEQGYRSDVTGRYDHGFNYTCILNTVPAPVLNALQLAQVPKDCLLIDLASKPGGLDWDACRALGLNAIHALALPGKVAPVTSGLAIRDAILSHYDLC